MSSISRSRKIVLFALVLGLDSLTQNRLLQWTSSSFQIIHFVSLHLLRGIIDEIFDPSSDLSP